MFLNDLWYPQVPECQFKGLSHHTQQNACIFSLAFLACVCEISCVFCVFLGFYFLFIFVCVVFTQLYQNLFLY